MAMALIKMPRSRRETPRKSHLLRLPPEILEHIASYCWVYECLHEGSCWHPVNQSTPEDQDPHQPANHNLPFRLVCRDINNATFKLFARKFFSEVTVIFTHKSLQRLLDVSNHPELSRMPRELTVGHHLLLKVEQIKERSDGPYMTMQDYFTNPLVLQMLTQNKKYESLPWDTGFLSDAAKKCADYKKAINQQTEMAASRADVIMLATALQNFRKMRAIAIADRTVKCRSIDHWGEQALSDDAGVVSSSALLQPLLSGQSIKTNTTIIAAKVLEALSIVDSRSRPHYGPAESCPGFLLKSLRVDMPGDQGEHPQTLQLQHLAIPRRYPGAGSVLRNLRRLDLKLYPNICNTRPNLDHVTAMRPIFYIFKPEIEELTLRFADSTMELPQPLNISHLFWSDICDRGPFRRLKSLEVLGPAKLSPVDITRFIADHDQTLRRFHMSIVAAEENSTAAWVRLFTALSRCSMLDHFSMGYCDDEEGDLYVNFPNKAEVDTNLASLVDGTKQFSDYAEFA